MSRRMRMRLALLAAFALLFQQCAFAAHLCMAAVPATTMDCAHMVPAHGDATPVCSQHCARASVASVPDLHALDVPPILLPSSAVTTAVAALPPSCSAAHHAPHPSPPLTDLYCSRQI
ncbi:MAG TPA: hypothetical protein VLK26_02205 [Rudaea sp.]|nr:hypothetical protein [Rudaea sp.]